MRTLGKMIFIGLVATTGCKWTDFDDLEGETWVSSAMRMREPAVGTYGEVAAVPAAVHVTAVPAIATS